MALNLIGFSEKADSSTLVVEGRGDLHLGLLFEKMRREGYEMSCTPPIILTKKDPETGKLLEPFEKVSIEVDNKFCSGLIEKLTNRGAIYESTIEIS